MYYDILYTDTRIAVLHLVLTNSFDNCVNWSCGTVIICGDLVIKPSWFMSCGCIGYRVIQSQYDLQLNTCGFNLKPKTWGLYDIIQVCTSTANTDPWVWREWNQAESSGQTGCKDTPWAPPIFTSRSWCKPHLRWFHDAETHQYSGIFDGVSWYFYG